MPPLMTMNDIPNRPFRASEELCKYALAVCALFLHQPHAAHVVIIQASPSVTYARFARFFRAHSTCAHETRRMMREI